MRRPRYRLNENFFEKIESEHQAYFFGLICADGCNSGRTITLKLQQKDRSLVYGFRRAMGFSGPVKRITPSTNFSNAQPQYFCCVSNKKLVNDLARLGCGRRKSLTIEFPAAVPAEMLHHFIRGYFDGDGGAGHYPPKSPVAYVVGTEKFCAVLAKTLLANGVSSRLRRCGVLCELRIHKQTSMQNFVQYLYRGATVWLERKHKKLHDAVEWWANRPKPMTPEEAKARTRDRQRTRRINNPIAAKEKDLEYRIKYRNKRIAYMKTYRAANPEKYKEYERRRPPRRGEARRKYKRQWAAKKRLREHDRQHVLAAVH